MAKVSRGKQSIHSALARQTEGEKKDRVFVMQVAIKGIYEGMCVVMAETEEMAYERAKKAYKGKDVAFTLYGGETTMLV